MFENYLHISGFALNANVGQHSTVHQIMCARSVASTLAPAKFPPLCLFDFPSYSRQNYVALKLYSSALQSLHCMGVADQRALHVVNAEAINHAVFDHSIRLVSNPGQKIFVASVGSIHVAVEHEAAPAAGALPASNHVGAALLNLLPCDLEAHGSPR